MEPSNPSSSGPSPPGAESTPLQSPRTPSSAQLMTPGVRPKPVFRPEPLSFSTKKERGAPPFKAPPKPLPKSCPPVSRVFKRRPEMTAAQSVTFVRAGDESSIMGTPLPASAVYDSAKKASYFEQAFGIEAKIGSGCFGDVYRVRSKEDGQLYAVKIARGRYRGQGDRSQKLEEVRKHQLLLPHSNCVHFYQSWEEKGRLYQQFELCEGSLMELAESQHDLPESLVWAYLVDLLLAVEHLHDHGLIHMDIKPENIFLGREGICKLGDFGLVIDLAKDDTKMATEGDPRYLATEILESRLFTKAADIFSLGVTILELATDLDLPKHGPLWHKLRIEGPDPSLTSRLSPDLRRVIQLMMTNYHERRPTVKQLLDLPAIRKAKSRRQKELFCKNVIKVLRTPAFTFWGHLWFIFSILTGFLTSILRPFSTGNVESGSHTPIGSNERDNQFSNEKAIFYLGDESTSLEDEFLAEMNKSSSLISSPLALKFSDDSDEDISRSGQVDDDCVNGTPKLSNASGSRLRFRSGTPGSGSPSFTSPKKRLNFDCFAKTTPKSAEEVSASPALPSRTSARKTPGVRRILADFDDDSSCEDNNSRLEPKSRSSRRTRTRVHFNSPDGTNPVDGLDDDDDVPLIKPISLAAKLDCFSDSD